MAYYEIYRLEGSKKIRLCNQKYEDIEYFKMIAKSPDYIILEDGKDVTKKYKKMK